MNLIEKFRYRPEIDGLRAVAVVAVVLYHADLGCSGGYIGVDVFFVISGFLISSLIWKDLESGKFSFAQFWERRARRIVPALVVVTLATLLAAWFLLLPLDFKSLGRAAASQAVFAANLHYWLDSGYFAGIAEEKPLLHTWSLAVEEQFYLLMPFALWGLFRWSKLRNRAALLTVLGAVFLFSFALSIVGVMRSPSAAFYLLPTRAWELLMGALLAFLPATPALLQRKVARETVALIGLGFILAPVFLYTRATPFPGLAALPPCLGTALIIWANGREDGAAPTFIGALLSLRPLVFVGLISYSLYLWHWPFLAFSKYLAFTPVPLTERLTLLALGFGCAVISWKWVETPFRKRRLGATRRAVFGYAFSGLFAVLGLGLLCLKLGGFPQRLPRQAQRFADAKSDMAFINELSTQEVRAGKLVPIGARDAGLKPAVLVWGDSHAMAAMPAVDAFLREQGVAGRAATHSSTAPVLDWYQVSEFGIGSEAVPFNNAVFDYIKQHQIGTVVLTARWHRYLSTDANSATTFAPALLETIHRLVEVGARPYVLLDVPDQTFDVPKALSRSAVSGQNFDALLTKPAPAREGQIDTPAMRAKIEAAGGVILNPKPRFLDPGGRHYVIQSNQVTLYRDHHHLTTRGAKLMLLPLLRAEVKLPK